MHDYLVVDERFNFQEMCRQARIDYEKEVQHNLEVHRVIAAEKANQKYAKHYNICKDVRSSFFFSISGLYFDPVTLNATCQMVNFCKSAHKSDINIKS